MAGKILTDTRIGALIPRKTSYDIRDGKLRGFGVRVTPSGRKRFFFHCQHRGQRVRKIVGEAGAMDIAEARSLAETMLPAIRRGEPVPPRPEEALFEAVAETVFRQYERVWKPRTLDVNRGYLKKQILPRFAGRNIADIDSRAVRNWFASLAATPVAADRSMPILSVIMQEAERMGLRPEGSNPCRGIRRYRRKGRERFLSDDEIRSLSAVLSERAPGKPLPGCRRPPSSADRVPQERDPDAALVGLSGGTPVRPRQQDRTPHRLAFAPRSDDPRPAAAVQPVGVPVVAGRRTTQRGLAVPLLAGCARRGGHRGCAPSRPPPLVREPGGDERGAGAGRLADARPFQRPDDAPLRPFRRPRDRGSGRKGGASHCSHDGNLSPVFPVGG